MNKYSFISEILNSKYYNLEQIKQLYLTLQRNYCLKITYIQPSSADILLQCSNRTSFHCQFSYQFRRLLFMGDQEKYQLVNSTQKHSSQCQLATNQIKLNKASSNFQKQRKQSNSALSIDQTHISGSQSFNLLKQISTSPLMKELKYQKEQIVHKNQKIYNYDQLSLLKKQLQLESRGLLSKSTELQPDSSENQIKRIKFHCKYEHDCPYLAILQCVKNNQNNNQSLKNLVLGQNFKNLLSLQKQNQKQKFQIQNQIKEPFTKMKQQNQNQFQNNNIIKNSKKQLFSLSILNSSHLNTCILQEQTLNYNRNTLKIDRQISLLTDIIKKTNQEDTKPKVYIFMLQNFEYFQDILKILAMKIGQEQEFIYDGLEKKINKRAIKKYFDNCVAKVRFRLENQSKYESPLKKTVLFNEKKNDLKFRQKEDLNNNFINSSKSISSSSIKSINNNDLQSKKSKQSLIIKNSNKKNSNKKNNQQQEQQQWKNSYLFYKKLNNNKVKFDKTMKQKAVNQLNQLKKVVENDQIRQMEIQRNIELEKLNDNLN